MEEYTILYIAGLILGFILGITLGFNVGCEVTSDKFNPKDCSYYSNYSISSVPARCVGEFNK